MPKRKAKTTPTKTRVERTRNGGQWTESRFFGFLRSTLRGAVFKWGPKQEAKKLAKVAYNTYQCAACDGWFGTKEVEVDHIVPAGTLTSFDDLPGFTERLFCEVQRFQVLCKDCHYHKTQAEKDERVAKKRGSKQ